MTVVGFSFTEIKAIKNANVSGKLNINNNVTITNVEKIKLPLGTTDQNALKFTFNFAAKYEPKAGEISLVGEVIYLESEKKVTEIEKKWKKDKKLEQGLMASLLNHILSKANLEALLLSREINLPPCVPMPRVNQPGASQAPQPAPKK